jgi:ferrous iron transport protein A
MVKEVRQVTIRGMRPGQSGSVVEIQGGYGLANRLNSLGIRPGKRITKVSSMIMHGPVTVQVDRSQVAIGFGMAGKILVEVEGDRA